MTITMSVENFEEQYDSWALAVGRFITAMGGCEFWTYKLIELFGTEKQYASALPMALDKRIEVVEELLSTLQLVPEMSGRVTKAIQDLRSLAGRRNLVAHNGPMAHVYKHGESERIEVRFELRSARDPAKDITRGELERLFTKSRELDGEFALIFGLVQQPKYRSA